MALTSQERQSRVKKLQRQWSDCSACDLCDVRGIGKPIFGSWATNYNNTPDCSAIFIMTRPAIMAADYHTVATGNQWEVLEYIVEHKLRRDLSDYWVTPAVLCPTNRYDPDAWPPMEYMSDPKKDQVAACRERIYSEIRAIEPSVIIAMGKGAVASLWPRGGPGENKWGDMAEATIPGRLAPWTIPVMPTYCPSTLDRQRGNSDTNVWAKAYAHIQTALKAADYLHKRRPE